jgi:succinate dehydrogenase / fumarate reductase cytochrome b subunit
LIFVMLNLLHFTFGTLHPAFDHKDVYGNVVAAFQVWWIALLYLIAMVVVGLHLYHGTWSSLRTLGLTRPAANPLRRRVVSVLTWVIYLGFSVIPIAVLAGIVK